MSYKSIMVHLELDRPDDSRIRIAANLAARFSGCLIGIAAADPTPPAYGGGSVAGALIAQERAKTLGQLTEAEKRFRAAVSGFSGQVEWRQAFAKPNAFIVDQARAADLVITGLSHGEEWIDPFHVLDPSALVMEAGRPVLVVPSLVDGLQAKRVLVAWKDAPEARRAVSAALPLLRAADCVVVVQILEGQEKSAAQHACQDVAKWLTRHGAAAVVRVVDGSDAALVLQELASDEAADLLVSGAYGHSRVREWVFGGVTRKLLTSSSLSCLLAH